jgi:hypothetical protein
LVERDLAKVEVAGSKPVSRSIKTPVLYSADAHRDALKRTKTHPGRGRRPSDRRWSDVPGLGETRC